MPFDKPTKPSNRVKFKSLKAAEWRMMQGEYGKYLLEGLLSPDCEKERSTHLDSLLPSS